ncbi:malonate--CoA ligase [Tropicimonas isoalkanivorans]|uniref:Malonyl-CoA/methylmalonyl-CoA synthetase n=1 Tax=Tropicimonas isoalkanivorans TaxID=441112 RepID=A0A1I1FTR9_9RHOB|nr:malonyl-CoA synthase [Tropicimonas isoalkanivorans]SFC02695.1 malonyl-CoA/methylmalonyl-CoA synthetase [Tropicimonas isoalkanivorans]
MPNPLFDALFAPHMDKETPFLVLPDGAELTHGAFLRMASRFANALTDVGLRPGDRLAVQVDKSPEALAVYAASVMSGLVFLPFNTGYTAHEVCYFIENSGARLVLGRGDSREVLHTDCDQLGVRYETLEADGSGSFAELARGLSDRFEPADREESDLAALLYTSGTTGLSKGAMLSQQNLLSNAQVLKDVWHFNREDVLIHALPIFHTHGLFVATNIMLLAGGSMIFLPRFDLNAVLETLPRATALMGVPTFYTRLLDHPEFTRDRCANMRLFIAGSAPLLAETHRAFEERTGHRILERYGLTETNMNTSNPYEGERRAGTVGLPLPGVEIRVTDPDTGAELPRGKVGMIEVRGPNVFQGYWRMPEKTAEELRPDGFFITGDLGMQGEDGYVTIVGRSKDLIISGGFNVYPVDVEQALDAQPGVLESAVIGAPHPDLGESVVAVLVPESGAKLDVLEIEAEISANLARFKQPRHYVIVDELPRNAMGKVQKKLLRQTYSDVFTA